MRDLKECQAEVFRRSEKKIKARAQRRKRIFMACVPLVLCLVIFGAAMRPGDPTADTVVPESILEPGSPAEPFYGMGGLTGSADGADNGTVQEPEQSGESIETQEGTP